MISEEILLKQIALLLLSASKFLFAAPASYLSGYSFVQTVIIITAGGIMGVFVFFFLGRNILRIYHFLLKSIMNRVGREAAPASGRFSPFRNKRLIGKVFTSRNRMIVRLKRLYGFPGIVILTPILFSIPLGTFLALKFYSKRYNVVAWLSLSVALWALILTSFMEIF